MINDELIYDKQSTTLNAKQIYRIVERQGRGASSEQNASDQRELT